MAARAEKRRRVAELVSLKNVSDSALCAVVERLREEPVANNILRHPIHFAHTVMNHIFYGSMDSDPHDPCIKMLFVARVCGLQVAFDY